MPGVSELGKMSKAKILQKYRPKILELGGKDELRLIKETFSVQQLREYVEDFFAPGPDGKYNKGGVMKKDPKKAYSIAEAKRKGLATFVGKDGKAKAAVTKEELEKAGYTTGPKGLRAYLNAKGKPAEKPKGGRGKPATAKPKGGVKGGRGSPATAKPKASGRGGRGAPARGGRGSPATAKPEDSFFVQVITGQRLKKNLKKVGKAVKGRRGN